MKKDSISSSSSSASALLTAAKDAATERCHGYLKPINTLMKKSRTNLSELFDSVELHLNVLAFAVDASLGVDQADLGSADDEALRRQLVTEHAHDVIVDSGIFERYIDFLVLLVDCDWSVLSDTAGATGGFMLNRMQNSADKSLNFCRYLAGRKRFFADFLVPFLSDRGLQASDKSEPVAAAVRGLVRQTISVCVNALFKDDELIYAQMTEYPLKECSEPYLKCSVDHRLSSMALVLIAFAVDESQPEVFLGARDIINYLIRALREGLSAADRRYEGFEVAESSKCINRLALNDVNKDLLVELELLPVLQQMLSSSNQVDVAYSLEILFTLSFSKKNAVKLATEFDKPLKRLQDDQRWNESKVLQSLVFHLGENKSHPRSVSGSTVGNSPEDLNQVMISYNHASKPIVKRLYNRLCESGLNVWVDFKDLTKGSTLDAMSDAVESSCIVLMCATRLYKESNNCRLEAEYAWKCNKKLIPVLMEPKYKATGWLGILMGTQLYYDLTEAKYPFEQKYPELLAAILQGLNSRGDGSKSGDLILDPPPVEEVGKTRPKKEDRLKWDAARVRIWCREHSLPDMRFGSITGSELHFLAGAKRNSPEYFGRLMERYFKFEKLLDLAKFANALDEM